MGSDQKPPPPYCLIRRGAWDAHQGVPSRPRSVRGKAFGSKKTANPKSGHQSRVSAETKQHPELVKHTAQHQKTHTHGFEWRVVCIC